MKVNEMVQIHDGSNSMGGMFIHEKLITGKVIKVNEKSIRIHMTYIKRMVNGKLVSEDEMNEVATFAFWKTVENRQFGKNKGKTVSFYKNNAFGVIEVIIE